MEHLERLERILDFFKDYDSQYDIEQEERILNFFCGYDAQYDSDSEHKNVIYTSTFDSPSGRPFVGGIVNTEVMQNPVIIVDWNTKDD